MDFANSAFLTSLVGALAGAFAGATAAQKIAERSKLRDELLREMRNTNASIALAFALCNSLLALKKQHIRGLKEGHDAQSAELIEFKRKRLAGEVSLTQPIEFVFNLFSIQLQPLETETLKTIVFERLTIVGRPLNLVVTLAQTLEGLAESVQRRNDLIAGYKARGTPGTELVNDYFGLPLSDGQINLDYPETLKAIYDQTDDGIFFSSLLCKDLQEHGEEIAARFKKTFNDSPPNISECDFTTVLTGNLMPDEANYADWERGFVKK